MKPTSLVSVCALAALAVLNAGCVALPMQVYVSDGAQGSAVYERCSFNPEVPLGVKLEQAGVHAIISVVQHWDHALVGVRFDVPRGTTLVLRENTIKVDARDGVAPRVAPFPNVNPAAPALFPESPAIQKLVLPVDTPLRGDTSRMGNTSYDRHYWIAAPLQGLLAPEVWVTLPEFATDSGPSGFPEVHFIKRFVIGQALFNC
jgi:hypothetical protein